MIICISISIVADILQDIHEAEAFAQKMVRDLPEKSVLVNAEPYPKFPGAYRVTVEIPLKSPLTKEQYLQRMCATAHQLAMPWSLYFDEDVYNTELIFNRTEHSKFSQPHYSLIRWAHLQFVYE